MSSFPKVTVIAIGKVKKGWVREGLEVYRQRVPELAVIELKDSHPDKEGEQILSKLKPHDQLIALTEDGKTVDSIAFAQWIAQAESNQLVFAIGSAEGISPAVKRAADHCLSLSPMTFPHEMARLLLFEQLYRAKNILQGGSYHK
ncbi:MAG: 23S rRNA (pseudouridine(1915)-N(3))-methyltransferase RlmH [Coleofasciculaceae cyanobacterium RL_1_1]|nr:23S rRNA (pseudouridine(1915)-N(3))-methyltransferase RlmH [Coleofasciculaceae cyanobacterium RL_1_1]